MAKEDGSHVQTDASGNPILKDIGLYLRGVCRKELDVSRFRHESLCGFRASASQPAHRHCCHPSPWPTSGLLMRAQCYMKYIDPSYIIRASTTITTDRIYCKVTLAGGLF